MKRIVLKIIKTYQKTLSLDHGPFSFLYSEGFCRFKPSCSEYTYQAINKYGILTGGLLGFWRVNRCNPLNHGGLDELPQPNQITKPVISGFILLIIYISFLYFLALILRRLM